MKISTRTAATIAVAVVLPLGAFGLALPNIIAAYGEHAAQSASVGNMPVAAGQAVADTADTVLDADPMAVEDYVEDYNDDAFSNGPTMVKLGERFEISDDVYATVTADAVRVTDPSTYQGPKVDAVRLTVTYDNQSSEVLEGIGFVFLSPSTLDGGGRFVMAMDDKDVSMDNLFPGRTGKIVGTLSVERGAADGWKPGQEIQVTVPVPSPLAAGDSAYVGSIVMPQVIAVGTPS